MHRIAHALARSTLLFAIVAGSGAASAAERAFSKDSGPASARCNDSAEGSAAWQACIGAVRAEMPDEELFHAGYWLAKSGRYGEALAVLHQVRAKDERVLTYIGFATRKQGGVAAALPLYAAALARNPDYVVARAYLGEAYLSRGEPARAQAELEEIAARAGTASPSYVDLARHIEAYGRTNG